MKNKQVIKAMTIGISASMLLNPVVAFAEEIEDTSEIGEKDTEGAKEEVDAVSAFTDSSEAAESASEGVKKALDDAETDLIISSNEVTEAQKIEGTNYTEAESAIDKAIDDTKGAKEDIQNFDVNITDEQKAVNDLEKTTELTEDDVSDANTIIFDADTLSKEAASKNEGIDEATSSEAEATKAVNDIENDITSIESKLNEAEKKLSNAQDNFADATKAYEAVLSDEQAGQKAIDDAKLKLNEAEFNLVQAQEEVDSNSKIAAELETEAKKLSVFNQMLDLKSEVESMGADDPGYPEKVKELTELIVGYYLIGTIDEGSKVAFDEVTEKYETGYEESEEGKITLLYKEIKYNTVTFTVGGKEQTKKIDYSYDENGVITIVEKNISAEKSEITILPKTEIVLTDEDGNEFDQTETSHVIYKNPEDKDEGFLAIDTNTSEVVSKESEEQLLPKAGTTITGKDADGNRTITKYDSCTPVEDSEEVISYELSQSGIAEIVSRDCTVKYTLSTDHFEETGGFKNKREAMEAAWTRDEELEALYGDRYEWIDERYTNDSYVLEYWIHEPISETKPLTVSKTVYDAKEYIDRTPVKYIDEDGNEFVKRDDTIVVYMDPENKKLGFYAAEKDSEPLGEDLSDPISYSIYERDESGRAKRTTIDYAGGSDFKNAYSKETYDLPVGEEEKKTIIALAENESLYEFLNNIQKDRTTTVAFKTSEEGSEEYLVDFSDPMWFKDAENAYAQIINTFGNCILEVTERIPVTQEVTGIVERNSGNYKTEIGVYVKDSQFGECATQQEAMDALDAIKEAIKEAGYPCRYIGDPKIVVTENAEGSKVWVYSIEYELTLSDSTVPTVITRRSTIYDYTTYTNADAKTLDIYDVSEVNSTLLVTDDIAFNNFILEKNEAYKKAGKAKESIKNAAEKYKAALESVTKAKEVLASLEAAGVPKTIIGEALTKYETAKTNLAKALENKANAEVSLASAKQAYTNAKKKLDNIVAKQAPGGSEGSAPVVPSDVADSGTSAPSITVAAQETAAAGHVVTISSSTVSTTTTNQTGEAVLGAIREKDSSVASTKSAESQSETIKEDVLPEEADVKDDFKADTPSDENKTQETDNGETKKSEIGTSTIKSIEEDPTALAATAPVNKTNPMSAIILTLSAVGAFVLAGTCYFLFKNRIH